MCYHACLWPLSMILFLVVTIWKSFPFVLQDINTLQKQRFEERKQLYCSFLLRLRRLSLPDLATISGTLFPTVALSAPFPNRSNFPCAGLFNIPTAGRAYLPKQTADASTSGMAVFGVSQVPSLLWDIESEGTQAFHPTSDMYEQRGNTRIHGSQGKMAICMAVRKTASKHIWANYSVAGR